jgi:hypothetical protein
MMKGKEVEATSVLHRLGTLNVRAQIDAIRESLHQEITRARWRRCFAAPMPSPFFWP